MDNSGLNKGNIKDLVFYNTDDGKVKVDVVMDAERETMWATQKSIAQVFGVTVPNISYHLKNIFESGELMREMVIKEFLITAQSGARGLSEEKVNFYNLDAIIAVGYRVNSKRATQFRIWATGVLKDYILKGYAINQRMKVEHYNELKDVVRLMSRTIALQDKVSTDEYDGLFSVINDYVYALDTLDGYDYQSLSIDKTTKTEPFHATYDNAMAAINALKTKFGGSKWFANEKDESFRSSIGQIYQTFGGEDLYPSVEEKAAMLLYLVVKNHSFSDGNKRIAAMLFLWFMEKNGILYGEDGHKRIADNTLVALTLMIAESKAEEKDVMVKVVVNLINQENK